MKTLRWSCAWLAAAACVWIGMPQADAFVRTLTCDPSGGVRACEAGQDPVPIFWASSCVRYHLNPNAGKNLDAASFEAAIKESFDVWNRASCSELNLVYGGQTDETRVGFMQGGGVRSNANVIIMRDEKWSHAAGVLALTSVTFNPVNGRIADADIEINNVNFALSTNGNSSTIDVVNTMAHEAGHFLGLDHSTVRDSTMFASAPPGETIKRDLDPDDEAGICESYPLGASPSSACLGAGDGFYSRTDAGDCDADFFAQCEPQPFPPSSGGCATAAGGSGSVPAGAALLLLLGLVALGRRRGATVFCAAAACCVGMPQAEAFVRTLTCSPSGGANACEADEEPKAVFWNSRCVRYHINEVGTDDTDNERANSAILASFDAWNIPACSDIEFVFAGFTDEDRIGYNPFTGQEGNANVIVFRNDTWDNQDDVLALTTVTFSPSSGRIFDSDIEMNGRDYKFTTTDEPTRSVVDVANTVTHEAGHFLGLDHSASQDATMFARAPLQELSKRSLEADDIDGLCAIYPAGVGNAGVCQGAAMGFFKAPIFGPDDGAPPVQAQSCGCQSPARTATLPWWATLVFAAGAVTVARRSVA